MTVPQDRSAYRLPTERGGSFNNDPRYLRSAARFKDDHDVRYCANGFCVVEADRSRSSRRRDRSAAAACDIFFQDERQGAWGLATADDGGSSALALRSSARMARGGVGTYVSQRKGLRATRTQR
jgi:hypothetical protein